MELKKPKINIAKLNFKNVYILCSVALLLSTVIFILIVATTSYYNLPTSIIVHAGIIFAAIILADIILVFLLIIHPMLQFKKVLDDAAEDNNNTLIIPSNHSPLMTDSVSSLKAVIDKMEKLRLRETTAQLLKKQAELDTLQSQINPHFLYNTLDTIRGQAHIAGQDRIEAMSLALSKLFRYSISSHDTLVSLSEELAAVDNYFLIQNFRFDNKFTKVINVDSDTLENKVPKMLIQPLVENAILHGLEPKIGKGTVIINVYKTETRLVISIDDDGIGIDPIRLTEINDALASNVQPRVKNKSKTSIGLFNIKSRIQLIYGSKSHFSISSKQNAGTTINISIPLV